MKSLVDLKNLFRKKKEHHLGISFSGGSARGYAHVGVLKALTENGIEPEIISGTSMGAIVGVLYAAGYSIPEIEKILIKEKFSKIAGFSWQKTGLLKMAKLKGILHNYIPEDNFSTLKKPFYLGLSDLNEGQGIIRNSGPLYDYLIASCSVPGIFAPMVVEETNFVDGGLICNLPASAIRNKCEILIGAHVNFPGNKTGFSGPKAIIERAINLVINQNTKSELALCDYVIDPPGMKNYSLFDFGKIEEIIAVGYNYTTELIASGELPVKALKKH